jgi:hypothetical protein
MDFVGKNRCETMEEVMEDNEGLGDSMKNFKSTMGGLTSRIEAHGDGQG